MQTDKERRQQKTPVCPQSVLCVLSGQGRSAVAISHHNKHRPPYELTTLHTTLARQPDYLVFAGHVLNNNTKSEGIVIFFFRELW